MYALVESNNRIVQIHEGETVTITDQGYYFSSGAWLGGVKTGWSLNPIPDQDISHLYDDEGKISGTWPDDLTQYTTDELKAEIDARTEYRVGKRVHQFASNGEQIAILRAQLVSIVNELGLTTIPEFDELNTIASEEIQKGQDEKASL